MPGTCLDPKQTSPRQEYLSPSIKEGSIAIDMYHVVGTVLVTGRYLTKNTAEMHVDNMGLTVILLLSWVDKLIPTPLLSYASRALVVEQISPNMEVISTSILGCVKVFVMNPLTGDCPVVEQKAAVFKKVRHVVNVNLTVWPILTMIKFEVNFRY